MERSFNQFRAAVVLLAAFACGAHPAAAQRLLDLPVRTWAGADATATGAAAAFWNPAGAALLAERGEVTVFDVLGPEPTGLGGFGAAAAFRVDPRTTLAFAYQHAGVEDILVTTDSPIADEAAPLDVGEHAVALAASRAVGTAVHAGVLVRYTRAAEFVVDRSAIEFGAGLHVRPTDLPGRPVVGLAARAERDGVTWTAGLEATPLGTPDGAWSAGASWGVDGGPLRIGVSHRFAAHGAWQDRVALSLGAANEPDAAGRTWRPVAAATLRFSRYALSVLRENMANDFGALHAFRFSVGF